MPRHLPSWLALAGVAVLLPLCATQAQLPGTVDLSFDPGSVLLNSVGTFSNITAVAVQPDGKILVATIPQQNTDLVQVIKTRAQAKPKPQDSVASGDNLPTLTRFNADGSVDASFNVTIDNGYDVEAIAVEPSGEIVIGGEFSSVDTNSCSNIALLKADGTFDGTFNPTGAGADNSVSSIVAQPDGKIVIGGFFTNYNATSSSGIIRVNADGSVDSSFESGSGFGEGDVQNLALQSDGKIIVAGDFSSYGDASFASTPIVRLNANGTLDDTFSGDANISSIYALTLLPNDQVVFSGSLSSSGAYTVARLTTGGSIDPTFTFAGDNSTYIPVIAAQPDGRILVGGNFYFIGGVPRSGIGRLNADGTLDTTFDPGVGANGGVQQIALRPDGEIFVAGEFNGISDASRAQLALLYGVDQPGTVQFSASSYNVNETGGSLLVLVQRTGGNAGAISVSYATADGTAVAGTDYTVSNGTLNWADGDVTPKSFTVPILNPSVYGGSKNFSINLSSPTGGATLGAQAQVLILDSDPAPQPAVTLTSPAAAISVVPGATVPLAASVTDPGSILSNVQFTVNGASVATITGTGPYVSSIPAGAIGTYTIAAVATDTQGRMSTSSQVLTVVDPTSNPAPSITLLTNLNNRKFGQGAMVPITVSGVSGDGSALDSVTFYADGVAFATVPGSSAMNARPVHGPIRKDASPAPTTGVFQANYQMPANTNQIINLFAVALSKLNGVSVSQSTPISSVEGVSPSVDQAPLVALSNSSNRIEVGQTLNIPVTASDPDGGAVSNVISHGGRRTKDLTPASGQIARMEYFVNQLKVKDSAQQPFGFTFTPSASGQYIVDAIATDGAGVSTVSAPVTVTAIAPPVVTLSAVGDSEAVAGVKNGKVLFTRSGGDMTLDLNVNYKVGGGTINGTDFQLLSGTLLIPAGQTSVKLKIKPIVEAPQPARKVNIKLLPATDGSYTLGSDIRVKLQLIDN